MKEFLLIAGLVAVPAVGSFPQDLANSRLDPKDPRLLRLQQFFAKCECPLLETAADFLMAADQNALDWRLLPSISMIESSGGKAYRNNNVFGWDSCRFKFSTVREGIHYVAAQLGKSERYKNKSLEAKLLTYNPNPEYPHKVKAVMRSLGPSNPQLDPTD